jgi:hypothetical protein
MGTDQDFVRSFNTARFLHVMMLVTVPILALILYWALPRAGVMPIYPVNRSTLTIIEITIGLLGVFSLIQGYLFPGRMLKRYLTLWANDALRRRYAGGPVRLLLSSGIIRGSLYESVAIYGFILGLFGAGAAITAVFFVVSVAAQVMVFPKEDKWRNQLEAIRLGTGDNSN